ncbi:hypothetical protein NDU88_007566 [Pleurodeles waltl]|uniref:Uncharacterized protein n=1 Tax=Pleurodeles waltl TaxID=8319 RepID=A0AAV7NWM5_PLEWA|nr:hypothetical protein NDU88_007566 [Pleurodeles waltl]
MKKLYAVYGDGDWKGDSSVQCQFFLAPPTGWRSAGGPQPLSTVSRTPPLLRDRPRSSEPVRREGGFVSPPLGTSDSHRSTWGWAPPSPASAPSQRGLSVLALRTRIQTGRDRSSSPARLSRGPGSTQGPGSPQQVRPQARPGAGGPIPRPRMSRIKDGDRAVSGIRPQSSGRLQSPSRPGMAHL